MNNKRQYKCSWSICRQDSQSEFSYCRVQGLSETEGSFERVCAALTAPRGRVCKKAVAFGFIRSIIYSTCFQNLLFRTQHLCLLAQHPPLAHESNLTMHLCAGVAQTIHHSNYILTKNKTMFSLNSATHSFYSVLLHESALLGCELWAAIVTELKFLTSGHVSDDFANWEPSKSDFWILMERTIYTIVTGETEFLPLRILKRTV